MSAAEALDPLGSPEGRGPEVVAVLRDAYRSGRLGDVCSMILTAAGPRREHTVPELRRMVKAARVHVPPSRGGCVTCGRPVGPTGLRLRLRPGRQWCGLNCFHGRRRG